MDGVLTHDRLGPPPTAKGTAKGRNGPARAPSPADAFLRGLRSVAYRPAAVAAVPWPHPTGRASTVPAPRAVGRRSTARAGSRRERKSAHKPPNAAHLLQAAEASTWLKQTDDAGGRGPRGGGPSQTEFNGYRPLANPHRTVPVPSGRWDLSLGSTMAVRSESLAYAC